MVFEDSTVDVSLEVVRYLNLMECRREEGVIRLFLYYLYYLGGMVFSDSKIYV